MRMNNNRDKPIRTVRAFAVLLFSVPSGFLTRLNNADPRLMMMAIKAMMVRVFIYSYTKRMNRPDILCYPAKLANRFSAVSIAQEEDNDKFE